MAIETEFQILNTLLAEKAAQLAVTESQLFRIFCQWKGLDFASSEVVMTYPQRFELRDRNADLLFLRSAREMAAGIGSATLLVKLNRQVARVVLERDDVLEVVEGELGCTVSSGKQWDGELRLTANRQQHVFLIDAFEAT